MRVLVASQMNKFKDIYEKVLTAKNHYSWNNEDINLYITTRDIDELIEMHSKLRGLIKELYVTSKDENITLKIAQYLSWEEKREAYLNKSKV